MDFFNINATPLDVKWYCLYAHEQQDMAHSISKTLIMLYNKDHYSFSYPKVMQDTHMMVTSSSFIMSTSTISDHDMLFDNTFQYYYHSGALQSLQLKIKVADINYQYFRRFVMVNIGNIDMIIQEIPSYLEHMPVKFEYTNRSLYYSYHVDTHEQKGFIYDNDSMYFYHTISKPFLNLDNDKSLINLFKNNCIQYEEVLQEKVNHIINTEQMKYDGNVGELILVPGMAYKIHKLESDYKNVEKITEVLNIGIYSNYQQMIEYYNTNEYKFSYDQFYKPYLVFKNYDKYDYSHTLKIIIKKLSLNIELSQHEETVFFENVSQITPHLFKVSKKKYLHVFCKLVYLDPCLYILATSSDCYLVIKNQQNFELSVQMPTTSCVKYISHFLKDNMLDLAKDNYGVILLYMHFKYVPDNNDYYVVNKLVSYQHFFKQIEYNFNTIELYKTLVYFRYLNTEVYPEQHYFYKYINENICVLYQDIIYKELLYFIFKYSRTEDLTDIIKTVADNLNKFYDNIYGIHIMKTIFEWHTSSPSFKYLYDMTLNQLEYIMTARYLNLLWFYFLENEVYKEMVDMLVYDLSEHWVMVMINLLGSKIGFNSIIALIEKYGYEALRDKFDYIKFYSSEIFKENTNNKNMIVRSIFNLERDYKNNKIQKKFLIYDFVKKENY